MKFLEYDLKHAQHPYLTIQEFATEHQASEIVLRDDNAIYVEMMSMDEVEKRAGDRAIVEYLGIFNDSDHLHFLVTPISKRNKIKERDQFEVLVLVF